jgi:hypothetical protein
LILSTLVASWYGMMLVHELGHVLAAWGTGSTVAEVRVPFFGLSQTEIAEYRHGALVVGMGPTVGVAVPLVVWVVARGFRARVEPLSRFFAGFCLVANGGYMASGLFSPVGDAADLAALGVPGSAMGVPELLAVGAGLAVWNGLGRAFGFGGAEIRRGVVVAAGVWVGVTLGLVVVVGVLG